ncbi:protein FAM133 isoform X2 [Cucurbita moschata]|uniref:Protein FAM133 isoform X2 n=1 Tax=Cucurbita moschata TaxID=3662 RepID=A0A6J1GKD4_CUCMO|nr:protein FAM133 isoform X2 [Cucurbita moschata]
MGGSERKSKEKRKNGRAASSSEDEKRSKRPRAAEDEERESRRRDKREKRKEKKSHKHSKRDSEKKSKDILKGKHHRDDHPLPILFLVWGRGCCVMALEQHYPLKLIYGFLIEPIGEASWLYPYLLVVLSLLLNFLRL